MHLTPIRLTRLAPLALATALVVGACGQVTGLSDDYTYDLEGGATADGASEGATTGDGAATGDGASDAAADATNKCTTAQTVNATKKLQNYNGTVLCKTCLASGCCNDVDTCSNNSDCSRVLSCKLDCTEKQLSERTQCFKACATSGGGASSVYQTTVGVCGPTVCKQECGLQ